MNGNDLNELKNKLSTHVATKVQRTINDDQNELNQKDDQKGDGNFVLFDRLNHVVARCTFLNEQFILNHDRKRRGEGRRKEKTKQSEPEEYSSAESREREKRNDLRSIGGGWHLHRIDCKMRGQ